MEKWLIIGLDLIVIVVGAACFQSARRRSRGETKGRWLIRDAYTRLIAAFDPSAVTAAEYVRSVVLMAGGALHLALFFVRGH